MNKTIARTLVDNWLLELSANLLNEIPQVPIERLDKDYPYGQDPTSKQLDIEISLIDAYIDSNSPQPKDKNDKSVNSQDDYRKAAALFSHLAQAYHYQNYENILLGQRTFRRESALALLHVLDLLVTNDELIFEHERAITWQRMDSLKPIRHLLTEVRIGKSNKEKITNKVFEKTKFKRDIVSSGAFFYLALAQQLGISYWPSPKRGQFISKLFQPAENRFVNQLNIYIDQNFSEMMDQLNRKTRYFKPRIHFPGFGSTILKNCNSRKDILSIALEFRNTEECKGFRTWLYQMDKALYSGNVIELSKNIESVDDLFVSMKKRLGLTPSKERKVELTIGFSPSLKIDASLFDGIPQLSPKPYHLVFLRKHFEQLLENANVMSNFSRLFG